MKEKIVKYERKENYMDQRYEKQHRKYCRVGTEKEREERTIKNSPKTYLAKDTCHNKTAKEV